MSNQRFRVALLAVAMLAGLGFVCACSGLNVSTERAPNADFTARKTFAWVPNPQMGGQMEVSIAGQRIRAEVEQALHAHGFAAAGSQPPDMLVDYRVILRQQTDLQGGARWGGVTTYHYTEGTLVVMLTNPGDGLVLWRGVAQGTVDSPAGDTGDGSRVAAAVQQMFAKFPN
jgi:hypothetical protein